MPLLRQLGAGVRAGLLAGGFVAATFFIADLARLQPLATPIALGSGMIGSSVTSFESPILASGIAIVSLGGHLASITLVHFLAFAALGACSVLVFRALDLPLNAWTGALYGFAGFSMVFYAAAWLTHASRVIELPSPGSILLLNLLAGAIMGGYFQLASRRAEASA